MIPVQVIVLALVLILVFTVPALAGGGAKSTPKVPAAPAAEPAPDLTAQEPEAEAVRTEEQRKLKQRSGSSGTVLTTPLGLAGDAPATGNKLGGTLLGRSGGA